MQKHLQCFSVFCNFLKPYRDLLKLLMKKTLLLLSFIFSTFLSYSQLVYSFTGNGNWSNAENWYKQAVPPTKLLGADTVYIKSNSVCSLDVQQTLLLGSAVVVETGADLDIMNNLIIQKNDDSIQYLIVTVDSFYTDTLFFDGRGIEDFICNGGCPVALASCWNNGTTKDTYISFNESWYQDPIALPDPFDNDFTIDTFPGANIQTGDITIWNLPDFTSGKFRAFNIAAPFTVHITEYDSIGGYVSGSFSAVSHFYNVYDVGPTFPGPLNVYEDHLITCKFRTRRADNNSSAYTYN